MAEQHAGVSAAQIDSEEFYEVLSKIHRHSRLLQNKPPQFVPKEDLVASEVVEFLQPYTVENGGPLVVKKV
jgi:acetylornithine deacetylase